MVARRRGAPFVAHGRIGGSVLHGIFPAPLTIHFPRTPLSLSACLPLVPPFPPTTVSAKNIGTVYQMDQPLSRTKISSQGLPARTCQPIWLSDYITDHLVEAALTR